MNTDSTLTLYTLHNSGATYTTAQGDWELYRPAAKGERGEQVLFTSLARIAIKHEYLSDFHVQ